MSEHHAKLQDNIFEWHFAIRGPPDTEFEGGIYHGRIILPPEYPFKPPSFIMISPSGRFETGVKICLSMSSHHPEHWQPSWSVRVALVALIAFLPTSGQGAIGSLDFSKEEKRVLAIESRKAPPKYGSEAKQQIINGLHARMLACGQVQNLLPAPMLSPIYNLL
ncbi:Ubiquitin-conjugating enzyme E2 32 [Trebouxia sp. C0010 RCD-2024]